MIYSFFTYFLEEMRRRGSQGKEMRRRVKKCAFYIVDFGGTEMAASGYNQKKNGQMRTVFFFRENDYMRESHILTISLILETQ